MKVLYHITRVCGKTIKSVTKNSFLTNCQRNFVVHPALFQEEKPQWGSKKKHRKVKLQFSLDTMGDSKIEEVLAPLRANVKEQVGFNLTFRSYDHYSCGF